MQRSERMQYMVEKERLLLLDLIRENRAVLLSRATDASLKARTWEKVAKSLAASGLGPQRTVKQLKKIWENIRGRAKKFAREEKKNLLKTGGDPPSPMAKPDLVLEKSLTLLAEELAPAPNHNDSDRCPTDADLTSPNYSPLLSREMYAVASNFQKEEHDIVMQIHKQDLENKKLEGEYLRQKMQLMTSLYAQAGDTLEDVRAVAASLVNFMDNFRKDQS